jgi:probable rRNA maturation factor
VLPVGVDGERDLEAALASSGERRPERRAFAAIRSVRQHRAPLLAGDTRGGVARAVVDDDDLAVGERGSQRVDHAADHGLRVVRGDHDAGVSHVAGLLHVVFPKPSTRHVPIDLTIEHGPHRGIARHEILRRIRAMIVLLQLQKYEVSFVLTDDNRVHQLNKIYRKKDRPTDVLAFAMREGDFAGLSGQVLGDVIISVETARRQAEEAGKAVLEEVTMLAAHGLLHLLGWDHDTPAKDRRMKAETERLLTAAGPRRRTKKSAVKAQNRSSSDAQSRKPTRRRAARPGRRRPKKAQ